MTKRRKGIMAWFALFHIALVLAEIAALGMDDKQIKEIADHGSVSKGKQA